MFKLSNIMQVISNRKRKVFDPMAFCDKPEEFWGSNDWCSSGKGWIGKLVPLIRILLLNISKGWTYLYFLHSFLTFSKQLFEWQLHFMILIIFLFACHTEILWERFAWCHCQSYRYATSLYEFILNWFLLWVWAINHR